MRVEELFSRPRGKAHAGLWFLLGQKSSAKGSELNDETSAVGGGLYKAALSGFFPHRQTRARGAPGIHGVVIRALLPLHPLQQIEHQILYGVGH
jgi:hypothetical protein